MRVALKAGAEIDTLSPDEFREEMERVTKQFASLLAPRTLIQHNCPRVVASATGVLAESILYECPTGSRASLHRIEINADGFTPGAPLSTAGAWAALYRDGVSPYNFLYPLPATGSNVLPTTITEGSNAAVALRNGQRLVINGDLKAANANLAVYVALQLVLEQEGQPS